MSVICQCPSCKTKYQVGDQYAGHTVKCRKCSAAVAVPAVAQPAGPTAAASKTASPGVAAKASSSISSKADLPKARALGRADDPPSEPAAKAASSTKIPRAVALSPADTAPDDHDANPVPHADDGLGFLSAEPAVAEPPRDETPPADEAPPADGGLGFLADEQTTMGTRCPPKGRAGAKRRAAPAAAKSSPAKNGPADDAACDPASVSGLAARSPKGPAPLRSKKKKPGLPAWLIPTIAAVGVVAVVGIGSIIYYLTSKPKPKPGSDSIAGSSTPSDSSKKAGKAEPKKKVPVLSIDWPENQRAGAELFVNDDKKEISPTGPIEIPLPPSKEQYHFRLQRRGFQPKTFARGSQEDDQGYAVSEWEPVVPQGMGWGQDFDAAKKTAASEHKNVFILFDASDSKQDSFACSRFREAVAKRKEFHERADREYVCVYIDNPQDAEAQGKLENAERNRKLTEKFRVTVFPTVVVTDPKGRPFGVLEDYKINGFNAFLERMDKWEVDRKGLFELLAKVDAMPPDRTNSDLVGKAIDFLESKRLDRFYRGTMKDLAARLPEGEGLPVPRDRVDEWAMDFQRAGRNADDLKKVMERFDEWKKTRTFKDHELAAKLHYFLAALLARLELREEAAQKCKEGLEFHPHDPRLRSMLEFLSRYVAGKKGDGFPAGSGTGFCVAQGNYVLTNHHVIDSAKKLKVRLNGEKEMYPASLIADNETGDMALLKVELPEDKRLVPIPLARAGVKIGEDVCALGFPGVMSESITVTLTKGVVSTVPPPDDEDAFIATDCKVNPGNSGGPLCNFLGGVAGMVTAKSNISSREDSYGLVIPVDRLRKFLLENLPPESRKLPPPPLRTTNLKLSDLAEMVQPSVVYVENIQ